MATPAAESDAGAGDVNHANSGSTISRSERDANLVSEKTSTEGSGCERTKLPTSRRRAIEVPERMLSAWRDEIAGGAVRSEQWLSRTRGGIGSSEVAAGGGTRGRDDGGRHGGGGGRLTLAGGADDIAGGGEEGGEGEGLGMAWGRRGPGHPGQRPRDEPLNLAGERDPPNRAGQASQGWGCKKVEGSGRGCYRLGRHRCSCRCPQVGSGVVASPGHGHRRRATRIATLLMPQTGIESAGRQVPDRMVESR